MQSDCDTPPESWAAFCRRADLYIDARYSRVMSPQHRDLVKCIVMHEAYEVPRPAIHRMLRRVASEVISVLSAGQTPVG